MSEVAHASHATWHTHQPRLFADSPETKGVESYRLNDRGSIERVVRRRDGSTAVSLLEGLALNTTDLAASYDRAWLRRQEPLTIHEPAQTLRLVDLFSGGGGLTLGVIEAGRALGLSVEPVLAVDMDQRALEIYGLNFPRAELVADSVELLLDSELGQPLSPAERRLRDRLGQVDIAVGGPPCQGHSNLNNHTRFDDHRNRLYAKMARLAEVLAPTHIIIENVPGVVRDKSGVVERTRDALRELGYDLSTSVIRGEEIGVPQARRRYFTVASRRVTPDLKKLIDSLRQPLRPLSWAISDLVGLEAESTYDTASEHSGENKRRIQYLFDNDLYDLPDSERPDCHRLKDHSYRAVYGRMSWDKPAPTITRGFAYTGRGRFVHPLEPRTLTPHEAARVQFIPDFFKFGGANRATMQDVIGNAVPPKMAYVAALELLR